MPDLLKTYTVQDDKNNFSNEEGSNYEYEDKFKIFKNVAEKVTCQKNNLRWEFTWYRRIFTQVIKV